MALLGVLTLVMVLNYVQSFTVYAFDAKPMDLRLLDNAYCEYGLTRRAPHKWCICWGRIDTRVEVLPWDCDTRAPKSLSRKKRKTIGGWDAEKFLKGLEDKRLKFSKGFLEDGDWRIPGIKTGELKKNQNPDQAVLANALVRTVFKEMAASDDGGLLHPGLKYFYVPFFDWFLVKRNTVEMSQDVSPLAQVTLALKLLLNQLDGARSARYVEEPLLRDLALFRSRFVLVKNSIVSDLEELLRVVKDFPGNQSDTGKVHSEGRFPDSRRNRIPPDDHALKTFPDLPKISMRIEPLDAEPANVPSGFDQSWRNVFLKLGRSGNYSKMAEIIGETVARVVGLESPKNVSKLDSVEIQNAGIGNRVMSTGNDDIPANLTTPEADNVITEITSRVSSVAEGSPVGKFGLDETPKNLSAFESASESWAVYSNGTAERTQNATAEPEVPLTHQPTVSRSGGAVNSSSEIEHSPEIQDNLSFPNNTSEPAKGGDAPWPGHGKPNEFITAEFGSTTENQTILYQSGH